MASVRRRLWPVRPSERLNARCERLSWDPQSLREPRAPLPCTSDLIPVSAPVRDATSETLPSVSDARDGAGTFLTQQTSNWRPDALPAIPSAQAPDDALVLREPSAVEVEPEVEPEAPLALEDTPAAGPPQRVLGAVIFDDDGAVLFHKTFAKPPPKRLSEDEKALLKTVRARRARRVSAQIEEVVQQRAAESGVQKSVRWNTRAHLPLNSLLPMDALVPVEEGS